MRWQGFLQYTKIRYTLTVITILCAVFLVYHLTQAATIMQYSDRISTSAPLLSANHTINFTTNVSIPAGGYIRFTPEPGEFTIPAVDFDIDNVALFVSTGSGYTQRAGTSTPSATEDGISITTGTSGNIEITLNSTEEIPAGAEVRLLMGSHTPGATTTDVGIMNPSTVGTHNYYLATGGTVDSEVRGHYAILEQVGVGPVDTRETDPPIRFNGAPMGLLSGTSIIVQMSLETNEFARCRYSVASGTPFASMGNQFSTSFVVVHTKNITVATSTSYSFFIRCIDDEGNVNIDDYEISFSIPEYPEGNPGDTGDQEGNGEGTGGGSGTGSTGSGSGSSGGDSSGSGGSGGGSGGGGGSSGSGGSSGGTGGSGGFEGSDKPYQSGDGRVIITGYAFPRSTIVALVDGAVAENTQSTVTGEFSITIDQIARGAYTFGIYGIDKNGVRSSTFSTTFTVTGSRGSTLSNINVMPSISVSPNPVDPNSTLSVKGYTIPNATVTIENQNDKTSASLKTFTATSDANGAWSVDVSTNGFTTGTYKVRAKARQDVGISTNFSAYTFYGVGQVAAVPRSSDLNRDGKVNLTDFSILLFWWNTDGGASNPPADINGDGRVSLTDFSILIFNWTG